MNDKIDNENKKKIDTLIDNNKVDDNIGILNRILRYNGYKTSNSLLVVDAPNLK